MLPESAQGNKKPADWIKPLLLVFFIVIIALLAKIFEIDKLLEQLRRWIKNAGVFGAGVFLFIYILGVVCALPGAALTVTAGALFGPVTGIFLVSIGSTIGAGLSFLIARYLARDLITRRFSGKESFRHLDELTRKHGAYIVAITRLVPLFPFNLLNYGFGLTQVPFNIYLFWSWLCMLPFTIVYVVGTEALFSFIRQGNIPWKSAGIVMAAVILMSVFIHYVRRRL